MVPGLILDDIKLNYYSGMNMLNQWMRQDYQRKLLNGFLKVGMDDILNMTKRTGVVRLERGKTGE